MKALVRNKGETVKETDGIVGINWTNGEPLTLPHWEGGRPYRLIENYTEPDMGLEETITETVTVTATETVAEPEKKIMIDGVAYSADEIRRMLDSL